MRFSASITVALLLAPLPAGAVARTLDLVTYTAPQDWNVEDRDGASGASAVLTKATSTSYCMIAIFAGTPAGSDLAASFRSEWQAVALKTIAAVDAPAPMTQRVGNTNAAVGSATSTAGGQPATARLLVLDAGASVASILALAPTPAAMKNCDAESAAMLRALVVRRVEATAKTPVADVAPAASAGDRPTRVAELAGEWGLTDGINETYVDRDTGAYAGTDSIHFRETWKVTAQGGISLDFFGIKNGKKIAEKSSGSVTLSGGVLVIKMSNVQKYVLRGWHDGPGGTVMVLNGPWYDEIPANILGNPEQGTNLDKKWLRRK